MIEPRDCFSNGICQENELFSTVDWEQVNSATGPIFVTGAELGNILVADILEINPAEQG